MNKYTEALEEMEYGAFLRNKEADIVWLTMKSLQTAREALEIAGRLEQADVTKHKKDYRNIEDSEWDSGYQIGYINGYNQALVDIRGDKE